MKEIDTVILEDNIEYAIIDKQLINNMNYLFLANLNDKFDICIRKEIIEDGEKFLKGLTEEEFNTVIEEYNKRI